MTDKIQRINNPLTIIAIFAALAEINATVAISLIDKSLHYIFIWFIIGFPTLLVICFFVTLNFNTKVMYSPSDYKDDKSFMDSLFGSSYGNKNNGLNYDNSKLSLELESKITSKLNHRIENIQNSLGSEIDFKKDIEIIKNQIKEITKESVQEVKEESILKGELKEKMLGFFQFPAFYLLIYGIIYSKSTTLKQLKEFTEKFYIPERWEGGMQRLFEDQVIVGDSDSFSINEKYKDDLLNWTIINKYRIRLMSEEYSKIEDIKNEEERSKFRELMTRHSTRLKF